MGRLDLRTLALLGVGVLAVSLAAPLMASLAVPALAISFWRTALAAGVIAPLVGWRAVHGDMRMSPVVPEADPSIPRATFARRGGGWAQAGLVAAAGLCLAAHFGFWVSSLSMTSVASSTAIVSLQVLWVVGWDLSRGAAVGGRVVSGVLLATVGAVVVGGIDFSLSPRALAGDVLALIGGVAVAAYAVIGGQARQRLSTATYTLGCYGTAAAALLVAAVVAGQPLTGYPADDWVGLLVLTCSAQLLGHSVFNHLLATVSPMVVSLAILLEVPGATIIAAAWLGQVPGPAAFVGLALMVTGVAIVVLKSPPSPGEEVVPA